MFRYEDSKEVGGSKLEVRCYFLFTIYIDVYPDDKRTERQSAPKRPDETSDKAGIRLSRTGQKNKNSCANTQELKFQKKITYSTLGCGV